MSTETKVAHAPRLTCDKQFHMYVWTKEPFFYAVAQARCADEARTLMLDEIGSGDGSCPEREKAAKWVKEQQPYIFHRENATFALTDSAEQIEQMAYIEKLQKKLKVVPDMLEALKLTEQSISGVPLSQADLTFLMNSVRAAIRKAEGQ